MTDKPELKFTEEERFVVDVDDFNIFINELFPDSKYDFIKDQKEEKHVFNIEGRPTPWARKDFAQMKEGNWGYSTCSILNCLVQDGFIKRGIYEIRTRKKIS